MHSADVSAREQFAFSEEQVRQILTELVQKDGISGAVLLATCNRTELYLSVQAVSYTHLTLPTILLV